MIAGFSDHGEIRHQSIWVDVAKKPFPMLITLNRAPSQFKLSEFGERLGPERFTLPLKYIATLDSEHPIQNTVALWETLCTNGLFNIWDPTAPYDRLSKSKSDPSGFHIQLLRLQEIDREFKPEDIIPANRWIDHLIATDRSVNILRPVIPDEEFQRIKRLLIESINGVKRDITPQRIERDLASIRSEEGYSEGKQKERLVNTYERNPKLRLAAILEHGTKCQVCGFDFEEKYGERGRGYIEVHHLVPVSQLKKETKVDPKADMTVVCSNCHRMIHRDMDDILEPYQLKGMLRG
jgi:hypothetical protein